MLRRKPLEVMPSAIVQMIIMGLLLGGWFAVLSYGLSIALGIIREINVAHGALVVLSAYLSYMSLSLWHMNPFLSLVWITPAMFALGWMLQRFMLSKARRVGSNDVVITTFAISIILANLLQIFFTSNTKSLILPYDLLSLSVANIKIPLIEVLDFVAGVTTYAVLTVIFKRTMIGKAMRALPVDEISAQLIGINPQTIYPVAMGLAMAVASVAGVFLGSMFPFTPDSGTTYLLLAFGVVVFGGLGNLLGTLIGGIILGELFVFAGYYIGAEYQTTITLLIIVAVLIMMPRGLFKGEVF
ncbi:MAG: branched-chain amino acid ABC transporter permease [Nitrososphaeria archaeon]